MTNKVRRNMTLVKYLVNRTMNNYILFLVYPHDYTKVSRLYPTIVRTTLILDVMIGVVCAVKEHSFLSMFAFYRY